VNKALDAIEAGTPAGGRWAPSRRGRANGRWVGLVVMEMLGVDETQAVRIVGTWLRSGVLVETEERDSESRKVVSGVRVVDAKRPGERR
jgi:hypothetical protein